MGTVSNEKEKAFTGKVRSTMFLIIPAIAIGLGSILLLLFSDSENFAGLRFELGRLWENVTNEKKAVESIARPNINRTPRSSALAETVDQESVKREMENTRSILKETASKRKRPSMAVQQNLPEKQIIPSEALSLDPAALKPEVRFSEFPRLVERLNSESILLIPERKKVSKFSVGVSMFPAYTYRYLQYRNDQLGTRRSGNIIFGFHQSEAYREANDEPLLNFGAGVDLYLQLNEKLILESGLGIQTYGEKVRVLRQKDIQSISGISPQAHYMNQDEIYFSPESRPEEGKAIPFINTYSYARLPIYLNYMFYNGTKYAADIQLGGGLDYLISADAVVYNFNADLYEWTNSPKFGGFSRFNGHALMGMRLRSYFSETSEVFVNPQVQCMLGSVFKKEYSIRQNHFAAGLRFGLRVHL